MINLDERFDYYMGANATIDHFREAVNVIVENAPNSLQVEGPFSMTKGTNQYKFKCSKNGWGAAKCNGNNSNYSIHLEFTWSVGDEIRLRLHFEIYPYNSIEFENLPISFRRLQTAFMTELHCRLQPPWEPSTPGGNCKWQIAICTIPAESAIRQVKNWFEVQSRFGKRIIDETIKSDGFRRVWCELYG